MGAKVNPFTFLEAVQLVADLQDKLADFGKLGIEEFQLRHHEVAMDRLNKRQISKSVFVFTQEIDR